MFLKSLYVYNIYSYQTNKWELLSWLFFRILCLKLCKNCECSLVMYYHNLCDTKVICSDQSAGYYSNFECWSGNQSIKPKKRIKAPSCLRTKVQKKGVNLWKCIRAVDPSVWQIFKMSTGIFRNSLKISFI